jgi:hypothetical protein
MPFAKEEISELGIGQLSPEELEEALEAFNGFASLFGRKWVDSIFRGVQAPRLVRAVVGVWKDWLTIHQLTKADVLRERWRNGYNKAGVITEVGIFARLTKAGVQLELFPEVASRVPDCRFRVGAAEPWIYLEASQRSVSEILER